MGSGTGPSETGQQWHRFPRSVISLAAKKVAGGSSTRRPVGMFLAAALCLERGDANVQIILDMTVKCLGGTARFRTILEIDQDAEKAAEEPIQTTK